MLADALNAVEESGQRYYEAETYRFRGELHLLEPQAGCRAGRNLLFRHALKMAGASGEVLGAARRNQSRPAVAQPGPAGPGA